MGLCISSIIELGESERGRDAVALTHTIIYILYFHFHFRAILPHDLVLNTFHSWQRQKQWQSERSIQSLYTNTHTHTHRHTAHTLLVELNLLKMHTTCSAMADYV